jgi:phage terminase small subunit
MSKNKDELNAKQLAFIDEYLTCMNATQAYMVVYPKASYASANTASARLLTNTNVKSEIDRRMKEHSMTANEVLARLAAIAQATLFSFVKVDEDGHIYFNFSDPEAKKHMFLIRRIKSRKHETESEKGSSVEKWIEVELHDAQRALELIGKYHALFTEKVERTERKVIQVTIGKSDE